jgi:hypothetical protein
MKKRLLDKGVFSFNYLSISRSLKQIKTSDKDGSDPAHYRRISLLSVMYKLLERLILQRIQPLIEAATLVHKAGFHKHRSCTEQVMALTTHIEAGFQRQLNTRVVFVDL